MSKHVGPMITITTVIASTISLTATRIMTAASIMQEVIAEALKTILHGVKMTMARFNKKQQF
jgi:hypothetical protein